MMTDLEICCSSNDIAATRRNETEALPRTCLSGQAWPKMKSEENRCQNYPNNMLADCKQESKTKCLQNRRKRSWSLAPARRMMQGGHLPSERADPADLLTACPLFPIMLQNDVSHADSTNLPRAGRDEAYLICVLATCYLTCSLSQIDCDPSHLPLVFHDALSFNLKPAGSDRFSRQPRYYHPTTPVQTVLRLYISRR
jgi:hypothetical protein